MVVLLIMAVVAGRDKVQREGRTYTVLSLPMLPAPGRVVRKVLGQGSGSKLRRRAHLRGRLRLCYRGEPSLLERVVEDKACRGQRTRDADMRDSCLTQRGSDVGQEVSEGSGCSRCEAMRSGRASTKASGRNAGGS